MIFVFKTRYSGWPVPGKWVALVERPELDWVGDGVEDLVGDVTSAGDHLASDAADALRRRCHCFGGDTPQDAMSNLLADPDALNASNY